MSVGSSCELAHELVNPLSVGLKSGVLDQCSGTTTEIRPSDMRLPSLSGHPISADLVSVGKDVHCESTAQEVHAGVSA